MRRRVVTRTEAGWVEAGSVILPHGARPHEVEHALAAVGVYAPRGLDRLRWYSNGRAVIRDASNITIVRLIN